MTEHTWHTTFKRACELFKESPTTPQLEQDVLAHFKERPQYVIAQVEAIGARIKAGAKIDSGWAILRAQLNRTATEDITVSDISERKKRYAQGRAYINNTGVYLSEPQLVDELRALRITDADDIDQLTGYWQERRTSLTRHEQVEQAPQRETPAWVRRWKAARDHGDRRPLPEQAAGILELHEAALMEGHARSGYEAEILLLAAPEDDSDVFVQSWEYAVDEDYGPAELVAQIGASRGE